MLTTDDIAKVLDTILSIPGMNEKVKIDLKITRKNALLLNRVIERTIQCSYLATRSCGWPRFPAARLTIGLSGN